MMNLYMCDSCAMLGCYVLLKSNSVLLSLFSFINFSVKNTCFTNVHYYVHIIFYFFLFFGRDCVVLVIRLSFGSGIVDKWFCIRLFY